MLPLKQLVKAGNRDRCFQRLRWKSILGLMIFFSSVSTGTAAEIEDVQTDLGTVNNFGEYIERVWAWGSAVVFAMAVIGFVVGGIVLISSGGNEDRVDMGRETVHGSVIAILITLMSGGVYKFLLATNNNPEIPSIGELVETLILAANGFLMIVGGASAVAIVYAGIKYMTSGGDHEKLESAKNALRYAIIGLVVAISSFGILGFLTSNF
jgi:hypothetical protein